MKRNFLGLGLVVIIGLSACQQTSNFAVNNDASAASIFTVAEELLASNRRNKGTIAGDYYLEVDRLYPYTPEAERALILAAKAYHDDGALLESRIASERYLRYFPGSKDAALAKYLVALSYYDGITDIKRDQARTFEALKALQAVMEEYPNSEYAARAKPKFEISLNQLAGKEMDIGRYYLVQKHFAAAIGRFKAVIDEYPENNHKPEAYHRLIEAYLGIGLRSEAQIVAKKLYDLYPQSPWASRAKILLDTGTQPNAGTSTFRQVLTGDWL